MTDATYDRSATRVLVVEDELFIAMEIGDALFEAGFEVLGPASSVDNALALLRTTRPDAAVLDVNLGREKVTPVALYLKSQGVPFVLATAGSPGELAQDPVFCNVDNLGKPTSMTELVEKIRSLAA
ncbi:response regulator [Rhizobium sp. FY34]|uniref:response regulator n=1 Tax=Rhizobium sp. FY34 TaxID=2562309 RepID=UPI0010C01F2E|nr:response regulator [Rhizobium sp. FY34]